MGNNYSGKQEEELTILEELEGCKINPASFVTLYAYIKDNNQLPPNGTVYLPKGQYTAITSYLTKKQVLGKDKKILEDGLKIFDAKIRLEALIDSDDGVVDTRSTGGINPCRDYSGYEGSGGINPCRD